MSDVEILDPVSLRYAYRLSDRDKPTLIPSWEKQGGTADDSSSASLRRTGNFSTADMGISPR